MDQAIVTGGLAASARQPIRSGSDYIESLRGRKLKVYLMGELVMEPVDHPVIPPSVNTVAETYDLANSNPELAAAVSPFTGERINRFLHVAESAADLVMQNKMQRRLGQLTGTCFQRCVGMDALDTLHSVTCDLDAKYGAGYHDRFKAFRACEGSRRHRQRRAARPRGRSVNVHGARVRAGREKLDEEAV
jgi:4-hydroxybutyryl-CoA dehydratase / vinylacetyl-CoA-Delta-isomerase